MLKYKMGNKSTKVTLWAGLTMLAGCVCAQQFDESASIAFGGFDVTPSVDVSLRYDDNVTYAATDKIDSWSRIIAPQLSMVSSLGSSQVSIGYRIVNEEFFSSKADNYTDHFFVAGVDLDLSARHRIKAGIKFEDGHDERGSVFSIGASDNLTTPDKYKQSQFNVLYSYGAFNADGRLNLNLNIRELDYDIGLDFYRARNRKLSTIGGTFFYRVGATTDLTFDLDFTEVDYKLALDTNNVLDSTNSSALVGIEWEATAKTSGFAKVGYQTKDFDSSLREDFSGVDWAAGVLWEPVDYASIELSTRADTDETNGDGNFIRGRTHSVEWRHEWLERVRSSATISWNNSRYEGQLINGTEIRADDYLGFNASVYYQFRRWLNFEFGYSFSERDSNRDRINYDKNQFIINALITL